MTRDILEQIDHVLDDDASGVDAMRWTPEQPNPQVALRRFAQFTIEVNLEPFVTAMRRAARQIGEVMTRHRRTFHLTGVAYLPPRDRRRHIVRCDLCNPRGNPPPMPRAQHGYRRRLNARRRRSRRH